MARSFSNAKVLSSVISKSINRRGFSAAAAPQAGAARSGKIIKKTGDKTAEKISWVPDPRTGCYRPENLAQKVDAAELRAMLLKKH